MDSALGTILGDVAAGRFPAPDGTTTIVPQPNPRDAGMIAFTAHSVVFTDEDPRWVRRTLAAIDCDPLAATMNPQFLAAFMERTGRRTDNVDLLTMATPLGGEPPLALREIEDPEHPRVAYARKRRDDVRVWTADGGLLALGRGLAGRWEASVEVDEDIRHRGLGRLLAQAARHLVPGGSVLWAQQAPGNARSVRAFQAAGFRPVGSEVVFYAR
ncbi:GNAT family N-acetyltransferase [Streptomyces sp. KLOTTS4A1]|uniref:GNAT family N-acetyltransferase n=1 Tax=Streptomyces sp. KLOTTS4A1 TaxID=3390996 RepID=UPI0039F62429